ncbi:hypothetical protein GGX14DRAFT_618335 [Mycena pura]|uniref:Uncharacterized protein n=1 Tax=Mycena pura TaxID=153505 RepID=A0AAD6VMQ8_9AGAR|nr:hypothetical protein GGX14DRAFT_618335 [Mycena pura]
MRCRGVTPRGCIGAPGPRTVQFSIYGLKEVKAEAKRNAKNVGRSVSGEGKGSAPKIEGWATLQRLGKLSAAYVHGCMRRGALLLHILLLLVVSVGQGTLGRKVGLRGLHQRMWSTRAQAARGRRRQRAHSSTERHGLQIFTPTSHCWHFDKGLSTLDGLSHELVNGAALAPTYACTRRGHAELGVVEAVVFVIEVRGGVLLDSSNADGERAHGYVTVMDIATTFLKCLFDSLEIWTGGKDPPSRFWFIRGYEPS